MENRQSDSQRPEQTPHSKAIVVLGELADRWPTPLWRESIADRAGLTVPVTSAALDELLVAGLVRRERPAKNDEWSLTVAGDYAARLVRSDGQ